MSDPNDPNDQSHLVPDEQPDEQMEPTDETPRESVNESPSEDATNSNESSTNFEQTRDCVSDLTEEDAKKEVDDAIHALMEKPEIVVEAIRRMKTDAIQGSSDHRQRYQRAIQYALNNHPSYNTPTDPFGGQDAMWRQSLEHNGEEIAAGKPRFSNQGGKLSGDSALLRVRAAAGLGTIVNVPLWHTGIWLKLKAPSEGTLLELERRIALEKISLGRSTSGASFANQSIYMTMYLVDMILNHVYDGTYVDLSPQALKSVIKITDIPQLVWGIASAIWPDGYRLVRPCVHDPSNCTHIDQAHINITKLSWVDNRALSTYQRNLMSHRDGNTSKETLDHYANEHMAPQSKLVDISSGLSVRLNVPTIEDYESAGYKWVDEIVRWTDEAFERQLRGEERDEYISQQAGVTALRNYSHWITEIVFDDNSNIEDRESIDQALADLSGDDTIRKNVVDAVTGFMREAVVSAIGLPRYDCPKCNGQAPEEDSPQRLPEIIQLEINEIFFTLQSTRVLGLLNS